MGLARDTVAKAVASERHPVVARLSEAKRQSTLETELKRPSFIPLIVVDLCRYRDYADIVAVAGVNALLWLGFSSISPAGLSA